MADEAGRDLHGYRYQACYCEENVWHLCQSVTVGEPYVAFITNATRQVLMFGQRAGAGSHVVWDYHVVFMGRRREGWAIWDLDCVAGLPLTAGRWLKVGFPLAGQIPDALAPRFRVVDRGRFLSAFESDRSHMRDGDGWLSPPPPWPPLSRRSNLARWIDVADTGVPGDVLTLAEFVDRFA